VALGAGLGFVLGLDCSCDELIAALLHDISACDRHC
jgi:hypothetical protein